MAKPRIPASQVPEPQIFKTSKCDISRKEFNEHAKPIMISLNGANVALVPQQFKTGSMGYRFGDKIHLTINGKDVKFQANLMLVAVGSNELPPLTPDEE